MCVSARPPKLVAFVQHCHNVIVAKSQPQQMLRERELLRLVTVRSQKLSTQFCLKVVRIRVQCPKPWPSGWTRGYSASGKLAT
eukprot:1219703-Amphidinium_carterae.1